MQWTSNAFPPTELSPRQIADCKRIAMGLVLDTLRDYDVFDKTVPREFDKDYWKPVRSKENLTVYRKRKQKHFQRLQSRGVEGEWEKPRLLVGNGTMNATLDEVMHALCAPDDAAFMHLIAYSNVDIVDGQTLAVMEKPTPDQPFHMLKLQWILNVPPGPLRGVVKPRDLVYIYASGIIRRDNDEDIGYLLSHSIDLPSLGSLSSRGFIRSRLSSCALFKHTGPNTVDVYMKAYFEAMGKVLDSVSMLVVANALLLCWNATECANQKKLAWLLKQQGANRRSGNLGTATYCTICKKTFGALRKRKDCAMCTLPMCLSCGITREQYDIASELRLRKKMVTLCAQCKVAIQHESSYKVAREEVAAGRFATGSGANTVPLLESNVRYSYENSLLEVGTGMDATLSLAASTAPMAMGSLTSLTMSHDEQTSQSTPHGSISLSSLLFDASEPGDGSDDEEWTRVVDEIKRTSTDESGDLHDAQRQIAWITMTKERLAPKSEPETSSIPE